MGQKTKVERVKKNFLLLCQQYNQMGLFMRAEAEGLQKKDKAAVTNARDGYHAQFQEIGEQLKVTGLAIDRLGGPSVMGPGVPKAGKRNPQAQAKAAEEKLRAQGFFEEGRSDGK